MTDLPETPPPARRRSRLKRILRIGIALGIVLSLPLFVLPALVSTGWARGKVEAVLSENLGTEVRIGELGFGWFSGARLAGLDVAQPDGFDGYESLLQLASFDGGVSLPALWRGRLDLRGTLDGLKLRVVQDESGATNLERIGGGSEVSVSKERSEKSGESGGAAEALHDMRLDLKLRDALVEIVREPDGVIERMEKVHVTVSKPYGTSAIRLQFDADLRGSGAPEEAPGVLSLRADVDADPAKPIEAVLNCSALDFARYRPLVESFVEEGQIEELGGVLDASVQVHGRPDDELTVRGRMTLEQPRFAGPLFADMNIRCERWELTPDVAATFSTADEDPGALRMLDLAGLRADLEFLTLEGLAADASGRPGLQFELDVERLAAFGGPLPEMLRGSGLQGTGSLRAPLREDLAELPFGELLGLMAADLRLELAQLELGGQKLSGIGAELRLADGNAEFGTTRGELQGGALRLRLRAEDVTRLEAANLSLELGVDGASVTSGAVAALRYAVPMFAGIDPEGVGAALESRLDLGLSLAGPAAPREGQDVLAWLAGWSGDGRLRMFDGRFRPAAKMSGLTQLVGNLGAAAGGGANRPQPLLRFDDFGTEFHLDGGFVDSGLTKLVAAGREFALTGRTGLGGDLDYTLDLRDMLRGQAVGEQILRFLGEKPIGAKLVGTLDEPRLAMPDLQDLAKRAAESALKQQGENLLRDVLRGGGRREGEEGQDQRPKPEDEVKKAAENLLRGLFGGRRGGGR